MDINLLKTFLEVYRTRHFGRAAENLFLTQSAVSARIRLLEENLGVSLFDRKRKDMQLTPAGQRFLKHAEHLVHAWSRACRETAQVGDRQAFLAVGGLPEMGDIFLAPWLQYVTTLKSELSLAVAVEGEEALSRKLKDGVLDVVFLFDSPQTDDCAIAEVCRFSMVLVASCPDMDCAEAMAKNYVMVDWGTSFELQHQRHFREQPLPRLQLGMVRAALEHIQTKGGAGYMPKSMVAELLAEERVFLVKGAPEIERSVLAVYNYTNQRLPLIEDVLVFPMEEILQYHN